MKEAIILFGMAIITIAEVAVTFDLESQNSKVRKKINYIDYKLEKDKCYAYALKRNTLGWKRIEDIPKMKKAITIDLDDDNKKLILSACIQKEAKKYWKLYIVDVLDESNIQIAYVEYDSLCAGKAV